MKPYFDENSITLYNGDCREVLAALPPQSVDCCVTSPPYWGLRDYGVAAQIGLEQTPEAYVAEMVAVFRGVWRVLKDEGTLWLNLGDSYAHSLRQSPNKSGDKQNTNRGSIRRGFAPIADGCKEKNIVGIPWRVAFSLQSDGWNLRQDIIWNKPNGMPESVTARCAKSHEYIFMLTKSERYYFNADAIMVRGADSSVARLAQDIENQVGSTRGNGGAKTNGNMKAVGQRKQRELGRCASESSALGSNAEPLWVDKRSVWTVPTHSYRGAHFATFPTKLIEPCIKAGVPADGVCLDPFFGAGTTGLVCQQQHVRCIGIELNPKYCKIAANRLAQGVLEFTNS